MSTVSFTYSNEEALIAGLESGNRQAFDKLYRTYAPAMLGYIEKIVKDHRSAEKVLQRAFVEIWDKRGDYNASRERLLTWLLRQAKHTAMQYLDLKQKKANTENQNAVPSVNMNSTLDENDAEAGKKVLDLLYYNKYTVKQVAEMMSINEDKLKGMLRCAVKNLKALPK